MGLSGDFSYIIVVAVSVIIVATVIVLMIRAMPGRRNREAPAAPERKQEIKPRAPFLRRMRLRPDTEQDEEPVRSASSLESEARKLPISDVETATIPITAVSPKNDTLSSPKMEIPIIPAEEEETETPETGTQNQGDDGLNTFRIEIAEDDGISRIAESLEEIDLNRLSEIAQDISSKRRKRFGR